MSASFEFTPDNLAEFNKILKRYPESRAALLPTLHLAQEQNGYISGEVEGYVAKLLNLPIVDVREVLTFYSLFLEKPVGRHHIRVCRSISCWLRDCDRITGHLQQKLGVESGGQTADGSVSWEVVADCMGACEIAPMFQLDKDYYGNLTPQKIDEILSQIV